jgi:hypothetical protein
MACFVLVLKDALAYAFAHVERAALWPSEHVDVVKVPRTQEGFAAALATDVEACSGHELLSSGHLGRR